MERIPPNAGDRGFEIPLEPEKTHRQVLDTPLKELIEILQSALDNGFAVSTSPTVFLLEAAIDFAQILGKSLYEGQSAPRLNQGVKEDENQTDSLGNIKMLKVGPKSAKPLSDPVAGRFLSRNLTCFLIRLKRGEPFAQAYHELSIEEHPLKLPSELSKDNQKILQEVLDIVPPNFSPIVAVAGKVISLTAELVAARKEAKKAQALIASNAHRRRVEKRNSQSQNPK